MQSIFFKHDLLKCNRSNDDILYASAIATAVQLLASTYNFKKNITVKHFLPKSSFTAKNVKPVQCPVHLTSCI